MHPRDDPFRLMEELRRNPFGFVPLPFGVAPPPAPFGPPYPPPPYAYHDPFAPSFPFYPEGYTFPPTRRDEEREPSQIRIEEVPNEDDEYQRAIQASIEAEENRKRAEEEEKQRRTAMEDDDHELSRALQASLQDVPEEESNAEEMDEDEALRQALLMSQRENEEKADKRRREEELQREQDELLMQQEEMEYKRALEESINLQDLREQRQLQQLQAEERQRFREEQDKEFRAALERDRRLQEEKELKERAERQRESERAFVLSEAQRKSGRLPAEPSKGDPSSTELMIRLPDGSRFSRRFDKGRATIGTVKDWVDSLLAERLHLDEGQSLNEIAHPLLDGYDLVTDFPRKIHTDTALTLESAGLSPRALLSVAPR